MDVVEKVKDLLLPELREIKLRLSRLEEDVSEIKGSLVRIEAMQDKLLEKVAEVKVELRLAERIARLEAEVEMAKRSGASS